MRPCGAPAVVGRFAQESEFDVVGEASSVETTLFAIDALVPDIVILDFGLGAACADRRKPGPKSSTPAVNCSFVCTGRAVNESPALRSSRSNPFRFFGNVFEHEDFHCGVCR